MTNVYIDSRRDGYSPSQCHDTMTVGELIDILSQYDEDQPVYIRNDNGYTYGSVQMDSVTLDIVDDVAERLLKAKTPYTFRERKRCTREALILAFLIYDIENLQERSFGDNDQILSIRRDSRN